MTASNSSSRLAYMSVNSFNSKDTHDINHDSNHHDAPVTHETAAAPQLATVPSATINLVKNVIAAGLLSLPWALMNASTIVGLGLLATVAICSGYSFLLLARCCILAGANTYKDIGVKAYGARIGPVIQACMIAYTFGSCVSFIVLIGDFIPNVLGNLDIDILKNRIFVILVISFVFLLPLSFLKDLNPLRFTSLIGVVCIVYACGFVMAKGIAHGEKNPTVDIIKLDSDLFRAIPIMTISFAAHYNGPKFFEELGNNMASFKKVVIAEGIIAFIFYALTGVAGYLTFGTATQGNVLSNFDKSEQGALWARLTCAFSVIFTYPFAFHSFKKNVDQALPAAESVPDGYGPLNPGPSGANYHAPESLSRRILVTCSLFAVSVGVAIAIPQIEVVLAYKGALFGSFVIFIFPGAFYLRLLSLKQARDSLRLKTEGDDGEFEAMLQPILAEGRLSLPWSQKIGPLFLIIFGSVTGIVGTITTIIKQTGGGSGH